MSLVPNVLLQNAMVEQNVVELLIRIMESTDHTDVKVGANDAFRYITGETLVLPLVRRSAV